MPDDMTIVWGATIQEQGMIGAGFAHEAIDFLVPLSDHLYVGTNITLCPVSNDTILVYCDT